jgi:hypothetical protein
MLQFGKHVAEIARRPFHICVGFTFLFGDLQQAASN